MEKTVLSLDSHDCAFVCLLLLHSKTTDQNGLGNILGILEKNSVPTGLVTSQMSHEWSREQKLVY